MLLQQIRIDRILGFFAAGTTIRTSSIIDMANMDGVLFIADFGTLITNGTLDFFIEQHSLNQTSGMARLATTTVHTVTAGNAALTSSAMAVDVYRPQERYLQASITPAVQNAVITGITAIRYHGRVRPDLNATLLKVTSIPSPAEV